MQYHFSICKIMFHHFSVLKCHGFNFCPVCSVLMYYNSTITSGLSALGRQRSEGRQSVLANDHMSQSNLNTFPPPYFKRKHTWLTSKHLISGHGLRTKK